MANKNDEALEIIAPHEKKPNDDLFVSMMIYAKYAFLKNHTKFYEYLTEKSLATAEYDAMPSLWHAQFFSLLNEKDRALDWLVKATEKGFINYPFLSEYDHTLENIRGEKRYKKLMGKVKREWENFEV